MLGRNSEEDDLDERHGRSTLAKDREITLGTTMILGIFFALAVFAAVFFGFGYSMGVKRQQANAAAAALQSGATGAAKPAPGSPLSTKPAASQTMDAPFTAAPPPHPLARPAVTNPDAAVVGDPPAPVRSMPAATLPASSAGGNVLVQVAAVSHQEDADLLVTTLKRRGYAVAIHQEPQDKLLHVQVGPFATRKEADGMREKLLADGFNAIVKDAPGR